MGRFELKYYLAQDIVSNLIEYAKTYSDLDDNLKGDSHYPVKSLYYDSEDFQLYMQNIDGQTRRKKVRLRTYNSDSSRPWFLEIKEKVNSRIFKRRVDVSEYVFDNNFSLNLEKINFKNENAVLTEIKQMNFKYGLEPKVYTEYDRLALFDKRDKSFRMTVDSSMTASVLDKKFPNSINRTMITNQLVHILELKGNDKFPRWCLDMVKVFSLKTIKFSKYVHAVDCQGLIQDRSKRSLKL